MLLPVIRWGKPYESLETDEVVHFISGEPIARVGQAVGGIVERDLRRAGHAREVLKDFSCRQLIERMGQAAELYLGGNLPMGDGTQDPEQFARAQSASTGLPEAMCRANMEKNHFVLTHMREILDALTRGLDLSILSRGYGMEERGVVVSYQVQAPVLGLVLPSNSPGVHTLWLPVIPMQVGLVLKPGPQEPWTPYRMASAMIESGVPAEAISVYPGGADVGAAVVRSCRRSMIFGGTATVERYHGDPRVQVHGPGFSKILLGDDAADRWEEFVELMIDSVFLNSGRSCINCSAIYAPRHGRDIAAALAERLGPIDALPPEDPQAGLAAFTVPGAAAAIWRDIETALADGGAEHRTAAYGPRLVERERCAYLRPVVVHAASPKAALAGKEYMFPYVAVVDCPQSEMLASIGPTLVCSAITSDRSFRQALVDAPHVDRLNLGPVPTTRLNWLQPHEGNIVDFLFRARALQVADSDDAV
jgi:acyl-CoA reductase-like NAD-dependent aldehyde dehydrogenase